MANIDAFTLISGSDICWNDLVTVRQPTLADIRSVGYQRYQSFLSMLLIQKQTLMDHMGIEDPKIRDAIDLYTLLGVDESVRSLFIDAFSFFLREPMSYDNGSFYIGTLPATEKILDPVKSIIFEISYIKQEEEEPEPKFASAKARETWLKIQKGKKALARAKASKADSNMDLPNIISAVAAEHRGYNLTNIWNLTVYQLYDQFARINTRVQIDVYGQRWAAWGQDDFDTSMWFKNNSRKE